MPVRAAVPRLGLPALGRAFTPFTPFWELSYSDAAGVGSKQEDTISEVRGADGCRGDTVPLRIPPARAQVPEDALERSPPVDGEETRNVFSEDPPRAGFLRDAPDLRPEPTLVVDAAPLPGEGGSLARETRNDEIHESAEASAIEGFQIVPDRTWIQGIFAHSTCEDCSSVGLPLNSTHKANSWTSQTGGNLESAVSSAEGEHGLGTYSHMPILSCAHAHLAASRGCRTTPGRLCSARGRSRVV
jgi:hypothetical protein